ncbi:hypothetical protein [Nocardia jejuensis]|uniref:hypothetical protein n=1 Tax=Nocardia jejuensis TaxID=328049 RepID=UPI0012FAC031|nr:hypothetical protein [Nocardia jejuensis]
MNLLDHACHAGIGLDFARNVADLSLCLFARSVDHVSEHGAKSAVSGEDMIVESDRDYMTTGFHIHGNAILVNDRVTVGHRFRKPIDPHNERLRAQLRRRQVLLPRSR